MVQKYIDEQAKAAYTIAYRGENTLKYTSNNKKVVAHELHNL